MNHLSLYPTNSYYSDVLQYIYELNSENINHFCYYGKILSDYYNYRVKKELEKEKLLFPNLGNGEIIYDNQKISYEHKVHKDSNNKIQKIYISSGCGGEDTILTELILSCDSKELLIKLCDEAKMRGEKKRKKNKEKSKETIRIYYYNEYWQLLSKRPKRPLETIYLKKGIKEKVQDSINTFFDSDTRNDYLSFGIPYKSVYFLYGVPGSGKTSLIDSIASEFNCDVYILPLTGKIVDSDIMSALSSMRNKNDEEEETKNIILIEDIDCIFEDRKEGDSLKNNLTLQGLLNCLDGFTCLEGSLMFITANNPDCLDDALIRSCRIDFKIELGYADKYQTQNMFNVFLTNQKDKFNEFYDNIKDKKYTTAMLQEFLFFNRNCENIIDIIDLFDDIIIKNDSKKIMKNKKDSSEMYL